MPDTPLLECENLTVSFGRGKKRLDAVKNVSFSISRGETFGVVGESGSGKTTLGRAIMRLYTPRTGEIRFKGRRISGKIPKSFDRELTRLIQMIFQDPMSSLNERAKIDYIISEGLLNAGGISAKERREAVFQAMGDVGLPREFGERFPHEFSGGQRQRVGIARALVVGPELVIADEPISALDVSIRAQVLNLMNRLRRERGLTYLFISHDLSVMRFLCDRILALYRGESVEFADTQTLFNRPLHPYTRSLLSAAPVPDPRRERNKVLVTYDPMAHDYTGKAPTFRELEPGHFVLCDDAEEERYRQMLAEYDREGKSG